MAERLLLDLLAATGMRLAQAAGLLRSDLRRDADGFRILDRPLTAPLGRALDAYCRGNLTKDSARIFPWTASGMRVVLSRMGRTAGIELNPQVLRRHFAGQAARWGMSAERAAEHLGVRPERARRMMRESMR